MHERGAASLDGWRQPVSKVRSIPALRLDHQTARTKYLTELYVGNVEMVGAAPSPTSLVELLDGNPDVEDKASATVIVCPLVPAPEILTDPLDTEPV